VKLNQYLRNMKLDYSLDYACTVAKCRAIRERATRLQNSIHDRGFALARTVGIPRSICCLHNASIDDGLTGWCARNPAMLKVAKRADAIVNDWSASNLGYAITGRLWREFAKRHGHCVGSLPDPVKVGNRHLLFAVVAGASVLG
jgi:hypothetical protein